jgi:uncharacterized protein
MQAAIAIAPPSLRQRVLAYLAGRTVLNLATHGPGGLWASAVLYVNEGTRLYFTSVETTRHVQNMVATGHVAGTVSDECRAWTTMKGLQLEGSVELVTDVDERVRVVRAYLEQFPFAVRLWHGESDPAVIACTPGIHGFYRITPTRLLFTDNEHAPGAREELVGD